MRTSRRPWPSPAAPVCAARARETRLAKRAVRKHGAPSALAPSRSQSRPSARQPAGARPPRSRRAGRRHAARSPPAAERIRPHSRQPHANRRSETARAPAARRRREQRKHKPAIRMLVFCPTRHRPPAGGAQRVREQSRLGRVFNSHEPPVELGARLRPRKSEPTRCSAHLHVCTPPQQSRTQSAQR